MLWLSPGVLQIFKAKLNFEFKKCLEYQPDQKGSLDFAMHFTSRAKKTPWAAPAASLRGGFLVLTTYQSTLFYMNSKLRSLGTQHLPSLASMKLRNVTKKAKTRHLPLNCRAEPFIRYSTSYFSFKLWLYSSHCKVISYSEMVPFQWDHSGTPNTRSLNC